MKLFAYRTYTTLATINCLGGLEGEKVANLKAACDARLAAETSRARMDYLLLDAQVPPSRGEGHGFDVGSAARRSVARSLLKVVYTPCGL